MKETTDDPQTEALAVNDPKKGGRKGRKKKHIFRGDPNYYNIQNNQLVDKNKEGQLSDIENDELVQVENPQKFDDAKKTIHVVANNSTGVTQNGQNDLKILDNQISPLKSDYEFVIRKVVFERHRDI